MVNSPDIGGVRAAWIWRFRVPVLAGVCGVLTRGGRALGELGELFEVFVLVLHHNVVLGQRGEI